MKEFKVKSEYKVEHCDGWGVIIRDYDPTDPELDLPNLITLTSYHETKDGIVENSKSMITLWGDSPHMLMNIITRLI